MTTEDRELFIHLCRDIFGAYWQSVWLRGGRSRHINVFTDNVTATRVPTATPSPRLGQSSWIILPSIISPGLDKTDPRGKPTHTNTRGGGTPKTPYTKFWHWVKLTLLYFFILKSSVMTKKKLQIIQTWDISHWFFQKFALILLPSLVHVESSLN